MRNGYHKEGEVLMPFSLVDNYPGFPLASTAEMQDGRDGATHGQNQNHY